MIFSKSINNILYFTKSSGKRKLFTCGQHNSCIRIQDKVRDNINCYICLSREVNNVNILKSLIFNNLSISNIIYNTISSGLKKYLLVVFILIVKLYKEKHTVITSVINVIVDI